MRISDWSSDVCSSDLTTLAMSPKKQAGVSFSCRLPCNMSKSPTKSWQGLQRCALVTLSSTEHPWQTLKKTFYRFKWCPVVFTRQATHAGRSEEHTSELQSLMRISYAVFCLKKKTSNHLTKSNI